MCVGVFLLVCLYTTHVPEACASEGVRSPVTVGMMELSHHVASGNQIWVL